MPLPTPVGHSLQGRFYTSAETHAIQLNQLSAAGGWVPQNSPLPNSTPQNHSLPSGPAASSSTLQPAIPNTPPVSTYPPDHTMLPQRQYSLTAHHFIPAHSISFNVDSGEPGIRLSAALNRRFTHLRDRDDLVFESSRSPTITMRLEVCDLSELDWVFIDGA